MLSTRMARWGWATLTAGLIGAAGSAGAQTGVSPSDEPTTSASGPASGYRPQAPSVLPIYGNPAVNPYLNPYAAAQLQGTNPDAALYFFAASQANGGIGSGVISGARPAPGVAAGTAPAPIRPRPSKAPRSGVRPTASARPVAEMPMATDVPGASASTFFGRGLRGGDGAASYFNRPRAHFQNNGR